MKNVITLSLLCCIVLFNVSCNVFGERIHGNGRMASETRSVSHITYIKLLGSMDVVLTPGQPSVRVEADENLLPYIITENDDNSLEIKTRDHVNIDSRNPVKVYVSAPVISGISLAGSGNITHTAEFVAEEGIDYSIAGSGNITMALNAPKVKADIAGSGTLRLIGETKDLEVHIAGSGDFDAPDLKAENATVSIAGSGDAILYADVRLKANIMGSGNVRYKGNAAVDKHVMGSGSIMKLP